MLVEQQKLWLFQCCHEQGERLSLSAGEQADLGGQSCLKAETERCKQGDIFFPLCLCDAGSEQTALAASLGECQIFLNLHRGGGSGHRILKDAAKVDGTLVLRELCDILAVDENLSLVDHPCSGDRIEHGRFSGSVSTDDGHKIAIVQRQVQAV